MATDIWSGDGNWNGNLADWNLNLAPGAGQDAVIESGDDILTDAGSAGLLTVVSAAQLTLDGAATLTTTGEFNDQGTVDIDTGGGGGAIVTIGSSPAYAALVVAGAFTIGNSSLTASTSVTAGSLTGAGTVTLWGNENIGTTAQATLDIAGDAPTTLTTSIYLHGDALLEFGGGGISTVAAGVEFQLDGLQSRASIGASGDNTALSQLSANYGTVDFEGDWSTGPGGATVDTTVALTNYYDLDLDVYGADGASMLSIGGVLTNYGTISIGNGSLSKNTTLDAKGLANNGDIYVQGSTAGGGSQAALNVSAAAPAAATGLIRVSGNGLLDFTSGAITSIGQGAWFELDGSLASAAIGAGAVNSALDTLATNSGTFDLRGDNNLGGGGVTVTTTVGFTNTGTVDVDGIYGGDGGSAFKIGGALDNEGAFVIGNTGLSATTTVGASSLDNTGSLTVQGNSNGKIEAELNVGGPASASATNVTRVGDALLDFASGVGITSIATSAWLELDGAQASIAIGSGAINSGLSQLASNGGTFDLRGNSGYGAGGVSVTTSVGFTNTGTVDVDGIYGGDGGSTFAIGGALDNEGVINIGTTGLSATTIVGASSLDNTNSLTVQGNSNGKIEAELNVGGPALASATNFTRVGDALLDFASGVGITSIATSAWLELDGAQASIAIGSGGINSGLGQLATNNGTLDLRGNSGYGGGGVFLAIDHAFTNYGTLDVDGIYGGDGGSTLDITGALTNKGTINIGTTGLSASTTVSASSLSNTGSLTVQGQSAGGAEAKLNIVAAAATTATNFTRVGDAVIDFGSGPGIEIIATGAWLELDGAEASIAIAGGGINSGLTQLGINDGVLDLRGNSNLGAGGVLLTIDHAFTNYGTLDVDGIYGGDGGSTLDITGALTNKGTISIGTTGLSATTTVSANSLLNTGSLTVQGQANGGAEAKLNITEAAATTTTNFTRVGDAVIDFGAGTGITTIATGAWLELDGAEASIAIASNGINSGLTQLGINDGVLDLRGNSNLGAGGVLLTIDHAFTNYGTLDVDGIYGGDGGSTLDITGALTNKGTISIGTTGLSATTTVSANSLLNTGSLTVQGNSNGQIDAELKISGAALPTATNFTRVGDAEIDFGSGAGLTTIAMGGWLELDGAGANIEVGAEGVNSGLAKLASNYGTFDLRGDTNLGGGGVSVTTTTGFANYGGVYVDGIYGGDGGSTLTLGGVLTNDGTFDIGTSGLGAATTVSAKGLNNSLGTLNVTGSANAAELTLSGAATNTATVNVNGGGTLAISGTNAYNQDSGTTYIGGTLSATSYDQLAGTTTVAGTLAAKVNDEGGVIDFTSALTSSTSTGLITISNGATLEFGAGVDSSHGVDFADATDKLELGSAGSFDGDIKGFADGDIIDLLNQAATSLTYSSNTLDVLNGGTQVAALHFTGSYSQSSFTLVGDGHGGSSILL